jgi:hypothetical protein
VIDAVPPAAIVPEHLIQIVAREVKSLEYRPAVVAQGVHASPRSHHRVLSVLAAAAVLVIDDLPLRDTYLQCPVCVRACVRACTATECRVPSEHGFVTCWL